MSQSKIPTLCDIVKTALYIGSVGYGGPAILGLMKKTIIQEKGWVTQEEFFNGLSFSQFLPGGPGVTLMGYLGYRLKGLPGGILMPFAFVFPAMAAITVLAWVYFNYGNLPFVHSIFTGLGAIVVAMLINATLIMGNSVFPETNLRSCKGLAITAFAFSGLALLHWNVFAVIVLSGLAGMLLFLSDREPPNAPARPASAPAPASPPADRLRDGLLLAALGGGLGLVFWLAAGSWEIFATFFKIGTATYGGGFAAIPVIQHVVVDGLHWLDLTAFRDGIALGQITPGPVFITATFIGYKLQGILGATVATVAVFAPSLALMMLLNRVHARIKNLRTVQAFIRGLLASIIGLLLSVLQQFGLQSLVNWQTWSLFSLASCYLIVWKKDALWLILATVGLSLLVF